MNSSISVSTTNIIDSRACTKPAKKVCPFSLSEPEVSVMRMHIYIKKYNIYIKPIQLSYALRIIRDVVHFGRNLTVKFVVYIIVFGLMHREIFISHKFFFFFQEHARCNKCFIYLCLYIVQHTLHTCSYISPLCVSVL